MEVSHLQADVESEASRAVNQRNREFWESEKQRMEPFLDDPANCEMAVFLLKYEETKFPIGLRENFEQLVEKAHEIRKFDSRARGQKAGKVSKSDRLTRLLVACVRADTNFTDRQFITFVKRGTYKGFGIVSERVEWSDGEKECSAPVSGLR